MKLPNHNLLSGPFLFLFLLGLGETESQLHLVTDGSVGQLTGPAIWRCKSSIPSIKLISMFMMAFDNSSGLGSRDGDVVCLDELRCFP
ncbi:hypothetical protein ASPTUDRAFT_395915 [Aspergillus tubingensis CBS 134.48]|uniref:Secreted protein n=1 Tax=Aspergillus tubingensis (strain CBS 134.48) TaxID=767770 RepID=A0A1L9NFE5_ASPTC|nr:hypothetical protein ASPTUDRAFT_395915 [Aspergillus tubingensis CBS 134.48]